MLEEQITPPEIPAGEKENYEQPVAPEDDQKTEVRKENRERNERSEISPEEISVSSNVGFSRSASSVQINEEEITRHVEELKVHERPRQVEMLAGLALEKGVPHAVAIAKKLDGYSLDALHDALVDDLYAELKKRGLIKEL